MTQTEAPTVDNGVNVEALIAAPAKRSPKLPRGPSSAGGATCDSMNGTHSRATVSGFFSASATRTSRAQDRVPLRCRPSGSVRVGGPGRNASRVRARSVWRLPHGRYRGGCLQHRQIQLRSVSATIEGAMDLQGIPASMATSATASRPYQGVVQNRRRRQPGRHRGHRGAVPEAFRCLRHRDQSDDRAGHGRLTRATRQRSA